MTVVVIRIRVADLQELLRRLEERSALKDSYGCTSSRLLQDRQDDHSLLVQMEFPSFRAAQQYCTMTTAFLAAATVEALTILSLEYFEDVPSGTPGSPAVSTAS